MVSFFPWHTNVSSTERKEPSSLWVRSRKDFFCLARSITRGEWLRMGRQPPQKESHCDGEMAQCVKYPQLKREHLSLDPQHRCKRPGLVAYSRGRLLGITGQSIQSYRPASGFRERVAVSTKRWRGRCLVLISGLQAHKNIAIHTHKHMHAYTHT